MSYTEPAAALLEYERWGLRAADETRSERQLLEGRAQGSGLVARLEGIADRDQAAALRGSVIEIERERLPATRANEFYRADLIGFRVRNVAGEELGVLDHFVEAPANAIMVVRGVRGEHWVPATPEHIREVQLEAGCVVVDWPGDLEEPG